MYRNEKLLDKTVEIVIAKVSNSSIPTTKDGGKAVGDFMQQIYDKLVELNPKDED